MIGLLLSVLVSVPSGSGAAITHDELYALAETEYRAGLEARADAAKARPHFRAAAAAYEVLWEAGQRSPALARNLAQAHLLAGDLAHAIRAYHRGLRISAHDAELRAGITLAREQVRYPIVGNLAKEARYHDRRTFLHDGPAWFFGAIAACVYVLALLSLARGLMSRRPLWWILGGTLSIMAILIAGAVLWEDKHLTDEKALPLAIVRGDGASLHRGNGSEFPVRIAERLPEGVEVIILTERGGWFQVQLAGGAIGWIDARHLLVVDQSR